MNKGTLPPECTPIEVMRYMKGWSWDNYESCPDELLGVIVAKMNAEATVLKRQEKDAEAAARFRGYKRYQ